MIRASIGLIMVGAILAGYETLSTNWIGYCFVMSNNILTAWLYTEVLNIIYAIDCCKLLRSFRFIPFFTHSKRSFVTTRYLLFTVTLC
jgi:hypothetical protein